MYSDVLWLNREVLCVTGLILLQAMSVSSPESSERHEDAHSDTDSAAHVLDEVKREYARAPSARQPLPSCCGNAESLPVCCTLWKAKHFPETPGRLKQICSLRESTRLPVEEAETQINAHLHPMDSSAN